jgi:hypothetical protein
VATACFRTHQIKWVRTSNSPVPFTVTLPQMPTRVVLDTSNILAAYK